MSYIHEIMDRCLTPRERTILANRYPEKGQEPMTLAELAKQFGISKERVRQITSKSLRRIRQAYKEGSVMYQYIKFGDKYFKI